MRTVSYPFQKNEANIRKFRRQSGEVFTNRPVDRSKGVLVAPQNENRQRDVRHQLHRIWSRRACHNGDKSIQSPIVICWFLNYLQSSVKRSIFNKYLQTVKDDLINKELPFTWTNLSSTDSLFPYTDSRIFLRLSLNRPKEMEYFCITWRFGRDRFLQSKRYLTSL